MKFLEETIRIIILIVILYFAFIGAYYIKSVNSTLEVTQEHIKNTQRNAEEINTNLPILINSFKYETDQSDK